MKSIVSWKVVFIAALIMALPAVAAAGAPTDRVKSATDKVIAVLRDPAFKGPAKAEPRRKKIRASVTEVFDFGEMAKRSLGIYWKDRSAAQKKEFTDIFTDLIERSYINRIENYSDEKVMYDKETVDEDYSVVKTRFVTRRNEEIAVDYKLYSNGGQWYVYDVVIENVSLVNNYRVQFNKVIRGGSYEDLVKKMKNKAESEALDAPETKKKK